MNKQKIRSSLLLLLTAIIWGNAFVAQSVGMDYVGPYTFLFARSIIGAMALGIYMVVVNAFAKKKKSIEQMSNDSNRQLYENKYLWIGGICCGLCLFTGSILQQIGIQYTTVGKAGFITAFYIVLVPVLGLFFKKRCGVQVAAGVLFALAGLYLLCINGEFSVGKGDVYVFLCALAFAGHILTVDYFVKIVDSVKMSCIQFLTCGLLAMIIMLIVENPSIGGMMNAYIPILYTGIMSTAVGYTLQVIGQKGLNPTVASLIMSLESVVSVIAGFVILNQKLSIREVAGCILMFIAIILAQLPDRAKKTKLQGH